MNFFYFSKAIRNKKINIHFYEYIFSVISLTLSRSSSLDHLNYLRCQKIREIMKKEKRKKINFEKVQKDHLFPFYPRDSRRGRKYANNLEKSFPHPPPLSITLRN